jgi:hypothetical protein
MNRKRRRNMVVAVADSPRTTIFFRTSRPFMTAQASIMLVLYPRPKSSFFFKSVTVCDGLGRHKILVHFMAVLAVTKVAHYRRFRPPLNWKTFIKYIFFSVLRVFDKVLAA